MAQQSTALIAQKEQEGVYRVFVEGDVPCETRPTPRGAACVLEY